MTPRTLAQRRRVLFTRLTTPAGRQPDVIAGIRQYLGGWPGIGRIMASMSGTASSSDPRRSHYPQLDAIRTFAVVPVMVHHLWWDESPLAIEGVKLFFVISGFLITQILLSAREGAGEAWRPRHRAILRFYGRRVVRIFPLYY